ncbi:hypothetical protein ElyMa_006959600 [Elysia marginata]|uniref:Uncharacterized protein n=1 Tax=Elysia marginata TaxID=1093978 RepID=A0AAV4JP62_9GAST|nr:hypothetical protein ElyMa_006959600 [Elysia marginata]
MAQGNKLVLKRFVVTEFLNAGGTSHVGYDVQRNMTSVDTAACVVDKTTRRTRRSNGEDLAVANRSARQTSSRRLTHHYDRCLKHC